jgi:hypothetical protein
MPNCWQCHPLMPHTPALRGVLKHILEAGAFQVPVRDHRQIGECKWSVARNLIAKHCPNRTRLWKREAEGDILSPIRRYVYIGAKGGEGGKSQTSASGLGSFLSPYLYGVICYQLPWFKSSTSESRILLFAELC